MKASNTSAFRVSVLIVSYKNTCDVRNCIKALQKQTYSKFDIVICENGGEIFANKLKYLFPSNLKRRNSITIISAPHNPGFAGAVNLCLKVASNASAWWILNPDTEPRPGALLSLLSELENGEVDAVGSTLLRPDGRIQSQGGVWEPLIGRSISIGYGRKIESPILRSRVLKIQNYINGASILITPRFVDLVGLMREDYFLYCEEVEWFLRAKRIGIDIGYANDSIVVHNQGSTTGAGLPIKQRSKLSVYMSARNSVLLMYDLNQSVMPIRAAVCFIYLVIKYTKALAFRQLFFAANGWFAGLQNRRGKPEWFVR